MGGIFTLHRGLCAALHRAQWRACKTLCPIWKKGSRSEILLVHLAKVFSVVLKDYGKNPDHKIIHWYEKVCWTIKSTMKNNKRQKNLIKHSSDDLMIVLVTL